MDLPHVTHHLLSNVYEMPYDMIVTAEEIYHLQKEEHMMDSPNNTTRLYYNGIEIPIQGIVMDTEPTPVQHPFFDDWQAEYDRIKKAEGVLLTENERVKDALAYRDEKRDATLKYLAEEDITRSAESAYVRNKYDKLIVKGRILIIRAAFLTDKAQREGKVQLYEYMLYKAGHDKWYVTGRSGHDTLLAQVRAMKNSAINGEFFIKEIEQLHSAVGALKYARDLPENPYKDDRDLLDW